MGFTLSHRHKSGKQRKEHSSSLGVNPGTEELLRNILGHDFHDYESKDGKGIYLKDSKRPIAQAGKETVSQQSQNTDLGPIKGPSGPVKEFFTRYILGGHENIIESNL